MSICFKSNLLNIYFNLLTLHIPHITPNPTNQNHLRIRKKNQPELTISIFHLNVISQIKLKDKHDKN